VRERGHGPEVVGERGDVVAVEDEPFQPHALCEVRCRFWGVGCEVWGVGFTPTPKVLGAVCKVYGVGSLVPLWKGMREIW